MKSNFENLKLAATFSVLIAAATASACTAEATDGNGGSLPSDDRVVADVTPPNDDRVVDVRVVPHSSGEAYLHDTDHVWYFDRGVVVRRKADVAGFPDAVVAVGGIARYVYADDGYRFHRFLTTYNAYEGIPAPSDAELAEFVGANLGKVFVGRAHNILGIDSVDRAPEGDVTWHSPTSFSMPFAIRYRERRNNTTIEQREGVFDIRFYKQSAGALVTGLDATERTRTVLATTRRDASKIDQLKTLATDFL